MELVMLLMVAMLTIFKIIAKLALMIIKINESCVIIGSGHIVILLAIA